MTTSKQKVFCVLRFAKIESAITLQREFPIKFGCQPPNDTNILKWYHQFDTTGCLYKGKKSEPNNFIWQQDGASSHWHLSVRDWLNINVLNPWIGRKEPPDKAYVAWLPRSPARVAEQCDVNIQSINPRSPDLTPCDFYLWGFIKDCVYVPRLPAGLSDFRYRMEANVARISSNTLKKVWVELAY
ncbi:DUF4817 domain-containing protein [Trichonephila clavipes]|nr:DUF4817 domain-containing protein [Trichonephila clavipes]